MTNEKVIPMQFHPRAFAAFGADLVTSDTVAVTELVKNSYDAFAYNVEVEFGEDKQGKFIQITDDGFGMTSDIIENSWAVIATPYKEKHPTITREGKIRRVSGNKGLGRFSAARLGNTMHIWTKNVDDSCLHAKMDWNSFLSSSDVNDCRITIETLDDARIFKNTGTIIRIRHLFSEWDKERVDELKDSLSRLISPFKKIEQFTITLLSPYYEEPTRIETNELIETPIYKLSGEVSARGVISWDYTFCPLNKSLKNRSKKGNIKWEEASKGFEKNVNILEGELVPYKAGPFNFEIRAWDLDKDSLAELTDAFDLKNRAIRNTIKYYKGLSIYRDDVLVLPKSSASIDWLGIDLRRVSNLGKRISTSQIVGIINLSASKNPGIRDATDREKLVDTPEYKQFIKAAESIVAQLQNLRNMDKADKEQAESITSLLMPLSATTLVSKIEKAVERGERYEDILEYVREYSSENEKSLDVLQSRLTYYAQSASVGSVALVILHEVLTCMTIIKRFLRRVFNQYKPFDTKTEEYFDDAEMSHQRLIDVAKSFAPLYRRDLRSARNECDLKSTCLRSIRLIQGQKSSRNVAISEHLPLDVRVLMHDGELQTILINLLDNACYWLQKVDQDKLIEISCDVLEKEKRIKITISDNGPGILPEDAQSVFEAGVTSKPHGIGMGLVIVTEILSFYDGKIATVIPGMLGGATFVFDLPIAK